MLKFWYEKFLFRFSFAFAFLAFLGVFVYAYYTEITLTSPGEVAPFTEQLIQDGSSTIEPEQRALPLEKAHRTDKELKNWINTVVSESLSFNKNSLSKVSEDVRVYYTNAGFKQYQEYLTSSGIIESVNNNGYQMGVYMEQPPLLLNGSSIKDVYRWLYQIPITVSFLQNGQNIANRELTLRVQIRRVKLEEDPNAVQIESWTVSARR